ncbi:hypothetical protein GGX14DRAFT_527188 [Mycena pura]|uniref:Uncharacterized protein n=1 Tax=Mycena pura TaxID=153505 RepID=A0AAD6UUN6_9AGAR|nr:hypothetical protein GGX14DRAFT_527188 [Mycena pura]
MTPALALASAPVCATACRAFFSRVRKENRYPPASPPANLLPELPAELWIIILEYSTYPCSSSLSYSSEPPPPSLELPSSFLSSALTPASLAPRLAYHRQMMRHKRNLALVSKKWHGYAQPVLYSFVWIARAAQAKALALTLLCQACCLSPDSAPATCSSAGRFIRRLHIETPALERCHPADLRTILDYAPGLEVYSDYRSVRRVSAAAGATELFAALAAGGALRRLSWTSYDDPALVGLGLGLGMRGGHMGGRLEYLELNFVSSALAPGVKAECPQLSGSCGGGGGLVLPELRTLKVTLDNATFAVLSTWALPALRNLSVMSADFSYASAGFRRFFAVHGAALRQLELGHSSAHIEEHYLTAPPPVAGGVGAAGGGMSLAAWCPHLEEFVCSADAEWNWQHPDWIAPHLLLPAHPTVSLIGIRGIDARILHDAADSDGADGGVDNAFFGLREQVESLLRREAFPRLRYVRDLSEGSDRMRRGLGFDLGGGEGRGTSTHARARVMRFWEGVLGRCRDEGVWLEDWQGWNVTSGSLRRARVALQTQTQAAWA